MSKRRIRILPELLSNKIAAGEVVERPASVVKELVENALDAGADRIHIEVEKGGTARVQVVDNGVGMGRDDALLALERYATSKIHQDADLFNIRTLGFRGEALPSIASVSRLVLETREADADGGTRIEVAGGRIQNVLDAGIPPGTLVEVKSLFFNTPARRKFLKTIATEAGHISDTVSAIALGWPRVAFHLVHNGKTVKDWPGADDSASRVADVLGGDVRERLRAVRHDEESVSVAGWIADPDVFRNTFRGVYVFVNGRYVRDRVIQHALMEGYAGRLMKGRFPVGVLFLTLSPDKVDVNVHPAKNEVRFTDTRKVHQLVSQGVFNALEAAEQTRFFRNAPPQETAFPKEAPSPTRQLRLSEPKAAFPASASLPFLRVTPSESAPSGAGMPAIAPAFAGEADGFGCRFRELRGIGQLHGMYVLCESPQGLVIIDQHAAHERILYEQLKRQVADNRVAAQQLLIPETVDLNHEECAVLQDMLPRFESAGIVVEPFGGATFVVKAVPAPLADAAVAPLILEIVETVSDIGAGADPDTVMDEILKRAACHAAIRAHQRLSPEEIRRLLADMDAFPGTGHCPHGRPTWIKWDSRFLQKAFGRIV